MDSREHVDVCAANGAKIRSSSADVLDADAVFPRTQAAKDQDIVDGSDFEQLEDRLLAAMRAGDAETLETLLADDLIFINQYGHQLDKMEDMAKHRSGNLRIERLDVRSRNIRLLENGAVVTTRVKIDGSFLGTPFSGSFGYTRVWRRNNDRWLVVSAHCSSCDPL
jgi:ketosteroid isomerase-like protein